MGCSCTCPTLKTSILITSIIVAVETAVMAILNFLVILYGSCALNPDKDNVPSYTNMEKLKSWFMIDLEKCHDKDDDFTRPVWYIPIPENFREADNFHLVNQHANFIYQIIFFILNVLWMTTSILLTCGGMMHNFLIYFCWLVLGILSFLLDTMVSAFYISFYSEAEPSWREGVTIFVWIAFFSRAFIFYIFNLVAIILAIVVALDTFDNEYRKKRREDRMRQTVIEMTTIPTSSQPPNTYSDSYNQPNVYKNEIFSSELEHNEPSLPIAGPSKLDDSEMFQSDPFTKPAFQPSPPPYDEKHCPSDPTASSIKDYENEYDDEIPRKK